MFRNTEINANRATKVFAVVALLALAIGSVPAAAQSDSAPAPRSAAAAAQTDYALVPASEASLPASARVSVVGSGYGTGKTAPELASSLPIIGQGGALLASHVSPGGSAFFFFSLPPSQYTALAPGLTAYIDLSFNIQVGPFVADVKGNILVPFTTPNDALLVGLSVATQLVNVPTSGSIEVTNGLVWTIGY